MVNAEKRRTGVEVFESQNFEDESLSTSRRGVISLEASLARERKDGMLLLHLTVRLEWY